MKLMALVQESCSRFTAILLLVAICQVQAFSADDPPLPETLRLKDFRPQSIYNIPQTTVKKAKYPAIDMHAHPYAKSPEQVVEWVRIMDEAGIAKAIVLAGTTGEEFDAIYARYAKYPDRFEVWCGFDYTGYDQPGFGPAAVRELERCHKLVQAALASWATKARDCTTAGPQRPGECTSTSPAWTRY